MARDLREQNNDVQELLQAKDAQLAVLRVRLDEADHKLKEKQIAAEGAVAEKQRYVVSYHVVIYFCICICQMFSTELPSILHYNDN